MQGIFGWRNASFADRVVVMIPFTTSAMQLRLAKPILLIYYLKLSVFALQK